MYKLRNRSQYALCAWSTSFDFGCGAFGTVKVHIRPLSDLIGARARAPVWTEPFVGALALIWVPCPGTGTSSRGSTRTPYPGTGTSSRGSTQAPCPSTGTSSRGSTRVPYPGTGTSSRSNTRVPYPGMGTSSSGSTRVPYPGMGTYLSKQVFISARYIYFFTNSKFVADFSIVNTFSNLLMNIFSSGHWWDWTTSILAPARAQDTSHSVQADWELLLFDIGTAPYSQLKNWCKC